MIKTENFADDLLKTWSGLHDTIYQVPVLSGKIETALILEIITPDEAHDLTSAFLDDTNIEYSRLRDYIYGILGIWNYG